MSARRPKPIKKFFFIQGWGTYSNETPVFVGHTRKEITEVMKKQKLRKEAIDLWEQSITEETAYTESASGFFWHNNGYSVISLPSFEDDWVHLDTVLHECFHATLIILGNSKAFIQGRDKIEDEGLAYQCEFLFREIRKKLQDEYWRKGRK